MEKSRKKREKKSRKWLYSVALATISAALGFLLAFHYLGISRVIGERVQDELEARGISISMRKLYLDPFGGIVAKDVRVFQTTEQKVTRIYINRIRLVS